MLVHAPCGAGCRCIRCGESCGRANQSAGSPHSLEEIVVTADFRESRLEDLPLSVSVLEKDELEATTQQHFEEAIRRIPNLNLSGEGSRARYFQLRGVGELEQYDGAPNPSIGFIVDDIDFSGLGSIATLFDIDRIEVLRGPQGTRYGANALGGLVYMRSQAPPAALAADFEATTGSDGTRALGAAVGGPLSDALVTARRCTRTRTMVFATTFSWAGTTPTAATS